MKKKEAEVKTTVGDVETITLSRPLMINGESVATLSFHFGELTGQDMEVAEAQVLSAGGTIQSVHEMNKTYLLALASRACRINLEELRKMNIKDATATTMLVQGFLLG